MSSVYEALVAALDDEYRTGATYQAVVDAYAPVWLFARILQSEQHRINALIYLFYRFSLPLPPDRWTGRVLTPPSLHHACVEGIYAEINNYHPMYDRLLPFANEADVRRVFSNLRKTSASHHLPAFQYYTGMGYPASDPTTEKSKTHKADWPRLILGAGLPWWLSSIRASADSEWV